MILRHLLFRKSILALMALLAVSALAWAEPLALEAKAGAAGRSDQPFSEGYEFNGVHRSIRLHNPELTIGEPLLFEIRLEGRTMGKDGVAEFMQPLRLGLDLHMYVRPPQGQPYEYVSSRHISTFASNFAVALRKGQLVTVLSNAAYDPDSVTGALFESAGDYLVSFVLDSPAVDQGEVSREVLGEFGVRVTVPARGDDNIAFNALKSANDPEIFASLQNLALIKPRHAEFFDAIIEKAPASALRPYARLVVANTMWSPIAKAATADAARVREVIALYDQFLKEYPRHPYAGTVLLRLIDAHKKIDEEDKSDDIAIRIWRDPELTHLIRPGTELYKRLAGEARPAVTGDWMVFTDPADAMKPDSAVEQQQQDMDSAIMQAVQQALQEAQQQPQ